MGKEYVECQDREGTCKRNQCECDAKFYKDLWHLASSGLDYNYKYNAMFFDASKKCQKLTSRMDMTFLDSIKDSEYSQEIALKR